MARVLVIPDSHLKIHVIEQGLELADKLMCDKVVLLGDYFDDWYAMDSDYDDMYHYLKDLLRKSAGRIVPLIGNHELSYLGFKCSGYNKRVESVVRACVEEDYRFCFAAAIDGVLYSHAGVTRSWVSNNRIIPDHVVKYHLGKKCSAEFLENAIGKVEDLNVFAQVGEARGGHGTPSCLWADLSELIADPFPKCVQVVGHTPVQQIEKFGNCWFTDVFSNGNDSDEYLYVKDGEPQIVHYNELVLGETIL